MHSDAEEIRHNESLELEDKLHSSEGATSIDVEHPHPVEEVPLETTHHKTNKLFAADSYAAKKTVAQGMMDIALITANANQLRYLLEYSRNSPTFEVNVGLIIISLILQMAVGVSLIFKGRYDLNGESKLHHANRLNNYVVVGIFIVTVINVFVAAFSISVAHPSHERSIDLLVQAPRLPTATASQQTPPDLQQTSRR